MRTAIRTTTFLLMAAMTVAVGCKKEAPPPPPAPEPPPPQPVAVVNVDLGKAIGADKRVAAPTATFGVRDTIYASVSTTGTDAGATLTARWTFADGQLVDSTSVTIAPTGPAVTEFHIMRGSAWPVGQYKVAILLKGVAAGEKAFEIKR
jgi:hypothetical protein